MPVRYMGEIIFALEGVGRLRTDKDYVLCGLHKSIYDTVQEMNEQTNKSQRGIEKCYVYRMSGYGFRTTVGTVDSKGVFHTLKDS